MIDYCQDYLRVLAPPLREEEEEPPELRIAPPPDERIDELPPDERTDELLEREGEVLEVERLTEGVVERVVVDTLEDLLFVVAVERTVLPEARVPDDTVLLREGVLFVRVVTECERVVLVLVFEFSTRVAVPRPDTVADVIRSLTRTLELPKVREEFVPRVDTRVVPSAVLRVVVPLRIAAERVRSISRALV